MEIIADVVHKFNVLKSPIESKQESFQPLVKNEKVEEQDDFTTRLQIYLTERNAVDIVFAGEQSESYATIILSRMHSILLL